MLPITVLAKGEAAVLAVFDPRIATSLSALHERIKLVPESTAGLPSDPRFKPLLDLDTSRVEKNCPWTQPPRFDEGLLLLKLREFQTGNAAPDVRLLAVDRGLAVLDLTTNLIFASPGEQLLFETPDWLPPEPPKGEEGWIHVGTVITHTTFGSGRVLDIGTYKNLRTLVIQFSDTTRLICLPYGLPHIRRRSLP